MIISHKHKFIFLHVPKAAGSSITAYLGPLLGRFDVQIGCWGNRKIKGGCVGRLATDLITPQSLWALTWNTLQRRSRGWPQRLNGAHKRRYRKPLGPAPQHAIAKDVKDYTSEWPRYFKFCFVRNPWERMASLYQWRHRNRVTSEFADFLQSLGNSRPDFLGWPVYTIDDQIAVDFVGRYENLTEDMVTVCERIGVPFDPERFPTAKKGPSYDYRDYYGPEARKTVERLCAKEIEAFGYEF